MLTIAIRSLACLLLGAVTTIASSWGFAVRPPDLSKQEPRALMRPCRFDEADGTFEVYRWESPGAVLLSSSQFQRTCGFGMVAERGEPESLLPSWAHGRLGAAKKSRVCDSTSPLSNGRWSSVGAFGWPLPALATFRTRAGFGTSEKDWGYLQRPRWLDFPDRTVRSRYFAWDNALPTAPLWPGTAVNTAAYSGAWAGLLLLPALCRRVRRVRAGRCLRCGYDLAGGLARCPECASDAPVVNGG